MKLSTKHNIYFLLLLMMITSIVVFSTTTASSAITKSANAYNGKDCTSDPYASASINYLMNRFDHGKVFPGAGECFGYAEDVSTRIASTRRITYYTAKKFNKTNFNKLCLGIKAGTHIRLSDYKYFNPMSGHSIVLMKVSSNKVYWADNNGDSSNHYNTVAYYSGTMNEFVNHYNFKYINVIAKTLTFRKSSTPNLSITSTSNCSIKLAWTKTTSTSKYYVYRAISKNGTYKRIATTTSKSFIDNTCSIGSTRYYKIRSIRSGTDTTSNKTSSKRRLIRPVVRVTSDKNTGKNVVSWKKVPNATSYTIYRRPGLSGSFKKLKNTTSLSYIDKSASKFYVHYEYQVIAIYSKNTKGNSLRSLTVRKMIELPLPKLSRSFESNGDIRLMWDKVSSADDYLIYRSETAAGPYKNIDQTFDGNLYYVDKYAKDDTIYYYKIKASYNGIQSELSNYVSNKPD